MGSEMCIRDRDDGDHLTRPSTTMANGPSPTKESKEAKELHALVKKHVYKEETTQLISVLARFCFSVGANVEGQISCTHHPLEA